MEMEVNRFDIFLISLDPTVGHEIKKTRPCVVVSPNEMNQYISTVIVAPMTTKQRSYPTRVECRYKGKHGAIVLDQIRTVDKGTLTKKLGKIDTSTQHRVINVLQEMFAL